MAQAYAGLVFDKSNVISAMRGILALPAARFWSAPSAERRGGDFSPPRSGGKAGKESASPGRAAHASAASIFIA